MARLARAEIFDPAEIVAVHLIGKTVRSCYLMGVDERSGKNFDHRKRWLEEKLKHLAANFGIDLLAFSCMSNHFHLLLRSRPDVVATWDDTQVALRWWQLCPPTFERFFVVDAAALSVHRHAGQRRRWRRIG